MLATRWAFLPALLLMCQSTTTAASPLPEGLLLWSSPPPGAIAEGDGLTTLIRERLSPAFRVVAPETVPGLAFLDPLCGRPGEEPLRELMDGIRRGFELFYDRALVDEAAQALDASLDRFLGAPCMVADSPGDRSDLSSAGVLLVRIHLVRGRPEAAAALARRLCKAFPAAELAKADVPPEVTGFLEGIRKDLESVATPIAIELCDPDPVPGIRILVDGIALPQNPPWEVRVAPGVHSVTLLGPDGGAWTRDVQIPQEGPRVPIDFSLSRMLESGPGGSLVVQDSLQDPEALALRLANATGRNVLVTTAHGESGISVRLAAGPASFRGDLLTVRTGPSGAGEPVFLAAGLLVEKPSWPWPWVSGGASAALLATGIVLNVQANREAAEISRGSNRVSYQRNYRAWSIATYSLSGLSAVGTILLAVFRPAPREKIFVAPTTGGAVMGFESRF
jgi:hypothetical protein